MTDDMFALLEALHIKCERERAELNEDQQYVNYPRAELYCFYLYYPAVFVVRVISSSLLFTLPVLRLFFLWRRQEAGR